MAQKVVIKLIYLNYPQRRTDDEARYLLSIIDTFSKFGYNYKLSSKKSNKIFRSFKDFINLYDAANKIHTDNGKEFLP